MKKKLVVIIGLASLACYLFWFINNTGNSNEKQKNTVNIPKFDRDYVTTFLSQLSGKSCSELLRFKSNYHIESIGLPDGFVWKNRNDVLFGYQAYANKNATNKDECSIEATHIEYLLPNSPMPSNSANKNFISDTEYVQTIEYQFFNGSLRPYKDTTISWKLVYKDQYGNGDTLDITTKFDLNDNNNQLKYYDSSDSIVHTPLTAYRIFKSNGDTAIWDAKDCNVHSTFFSCARLREKADLTFFFSGDLELNPVNKKNLVEIFDTTYINLNFGEKPLSSYIPPTEKPNTFPIKGVAEFFSHLPAKHCYELLRFRSHYSLEAIGLPDFLTWTNDYPTSRIGPTIKFVQTKNGTRIDTENKCIIEPRKDAYREYRRYRFEQIPEKLQTYDYQIFNNSLKSNKDTTFTWKLVYKDQYGQGDTLNIKTKIDSHEPRDKIITKCYNAITSNQGSGKHCKFDEEICPEAKKYRNPSCMIHKKTGKCFCEEGPRSEFI